MYLSFWMLIKAFVSDNYQGKQGIISQKRKHKLKKTPKMSDIYKTIKQ